MSMAEQSHRAYQQNQIMTASQEKLVLLLYDGAIRFLRQAEEACEAKDWNKCSNNLLRVQEIITELQASLNREDGGRLAENLFLLYDFMFRRLVEANIKKDIRLIAEVRDLLPELRDAWQQITLRHQSHNYNTNSLRLQG
ncbi:MAG: flagellar export chaperone FliS [Syntrophomonadaceae bacterium]|nr:flagellar export chaperone FliS [Syntrophomonadaceae bacterium]